MERLDEGRQPRMICASVQKSIVGRLVNSRMKWAGHVERLDEDCEPMKARVHQQQ